METAPLIEEKLVMETVKIKKMKRVAIFGFISPSSLFHFRYHCVTVEIIILLYHLYYHFSENLKQAVDNNYFINNA